ncbi:O-antigen ligase family protein [Patescibacteria group bacterium]
MTIKFLKNLQIYVFYLLVFLLPSNISKHWPQNWSLVNGILVDYLIPTLFLTDILILVLLLFWLIENLKSKGLKNIIFKNSRLFILSSALFIFLFFSSFYTVNYQAALYKSLKLLVFFAFALWVYKKSPSFIFQKASKFKQIMALSIIWQSILTICQWFKQGSVFGYWFFGEQPYNNASLGIKIISFFGQLKIPSMGTFTHPNVLAGFLVIYLLFVFIKTSSRRSLLEIISVGLGSIALILTFSFPAIFIYVCFLLFFIFKKLSSKVFKLLLIVFLLILIFLGDKLIDPASLTRRLKLTSISMSMWQTSPLFGVGLNNFIPNMEKFGIVSLNSRFLQPVHNIYLLTLAETGIVGIIIFTFFIISNLKRLVKLKAQKAKILLPILLSVLFLGVFDHYFLTIQQGMLLFVLVLGLTSSATAAATATAATAGKTSGRANTRSSIRRRKSS